MTLTSPAFAYEQLIPVIHTCDGKDISPELEIHDVPVGAVSLALIMDDPDALGGTFTHWLLWNIPPKITKIEKGSIPASTTEGTNDFGNVGYGGPCPPSGTHRYVFTLYALDTRLELERAAKKTELQEVMENHILADAELMGKYGR